MTKSKVSKEIAGMLSLLATISSVQCAEYMDVRIKPIGYGTVVRVIPLAETGAWLSAIHCESECRGYVSAISAERVSEGDQVRVCSLTAIGDSPTEMTHILCVKTR